MNPRDCANICRGDWIPSCSVLIIHVPILIIDNNLSMGSQVRLNSVNVLLAVILLYWKYLHAVKLLYVSKLLYLYMCNVFINKVQLAFGNEEGIVSLCLNDDTTQVKMIAFHQEAQRKQRVVDRKHEALEKLRKRRVRNKAS